MGLAIVENYYYPVAEKARGGSIYLSLERTKFLTGAVVTGRWTQSTHINLAGRELREKIF